MSSSRSSMPLMRTICGQLPAPPMHTYQVKEEAEEAYPSRDPPVLLLLLPGSLCLAPVLGGPPAAPDAEAVPGSGFTRAELGPGVTAGIELEAALPALVDCIKNQFGWSQCGHTAFIPQLCPSRLTSLAEPLNRCFRDSLHGRGEARGLTTSSIDSASEAAVMGSSLMPEELCLRRRPFLATGCESGMALRAICPHTARTSSKVCSPTNSKPSSLSLASAAAADFAVGAAEGAAERAMAEETAEGEASLAFTVVTPGMSDRLAHLMLQQIQLKRRQVTVICGEVLGQEELQNSLRSRDKVFGLVTFIQNDQTVALSVSASQPLHDMEESGAWQNTLCPGIWQVAANTIAGVHVLIVHCLKGGFLQRRYEQAVRDEHDSLLVDLVNAALWQRCAALQGQDTSQMIGSYGGVYGVEPQECALRVNTDVHIPGQTADMGCYITEKGKRDMTEREHEEEHYAIG
ncbi:MAG: hypothetical protein FRX49_10805 [Trebouxia sp. A1-2]|nr:MAG: hypothetical protein FRX49_10805 [Trebouxia sp. A1-2]